MGRQLAGSFGSRYCQLVESIQYIICRLCFGKTNPTRTDRTNLATTHSIEREIFASGETDTIEKMRRRIECDLYYVDNWSFLLDIKIIVMTLFSKRAYTNAV